MSFPQLHHRIKKKPCYTKGHLLKFAIEPQVRHNVCTAVRKCYKPPFVFHEIVDIINFDGFRQPVNQNIKTLGVFKQNKLIDHRCSIFKSDSLSVKLKFLVNAPQPNQTVEVYGYLSPQKEIVVKFWTQVVGDVQRYWTNLKLQKAQYTPLCYKEVECVESSVPVVPEYFDEDDNSYLINNVNCIEEMIKGLEN
uniref:Uncharacterized protein n=1 Tax=Photinus pyralis TaxID=7054 RepID=A0A1Y1LP24_PHOPY